VGKGEDRGPTHRTGVDKAAVLQAGQMRRDRLLVSMPGRCAKRPETGRAQTGPGKCQERR